MGKARQVAAFFDLDGTLIDINSGFHWALHERRAGNIGRRQMARASILAALYRLAVVDVETAYAEAVRHYTGVLRDDLDRRTRAWFSELIAPRLRPGARRAIEEHRSQGHKLVLLTSVSVYEAAVAAETWGLDAWLANDYPLQDGRLTGMLPKPLCYGAGKVAYAERWAAEHDVDVDNSWFYTDSYTDLPMLERVAKPRIVGPDPRLRLVARRRRWPILDW